jgi:hypothetical protein
MASYNSVIDSKLYREKKAKERKDRREQSERFMRRSVVLCTPSKSTSPEMQAYIQQQILSTRKRWIYDILYADSEKENIILNTPNFILLPDTDALNDGKVLNWMAIFKDTSLQSIRSLTAEHLPILRECRDTCIEYIIQKTNYHIGDVLAYFHYLPSVFQLHVHFCAPYGKYTTHDVCKIHTLDNVISNLEIDTLYYQKVSITTVVIGRSDLCSVYNTPTQAHTPRTQTETLTQTHLRPKAETDGVDDITPSLIDDDGGH